MTLVTLEDQINQGCWIKWNSLLRKNISIVSLRKSLTKFCQWFPLIHNIKFKLLYIWDHSGVISPCSAASCPLTSLFNFRPHLHPPPHCLLALCYCNLVLPVTYTFSPSTIMTHSCLASLNPFFTTLGMHFLILNPI